MAWTRYQSAFTQSDQVEEIVLERVSARIRAFPGYAQVRRAAVLPEAWRIENGLVTPTVKVRRAKVVEAYHSDMKEFMRSANNNDQS